MLYILISALTYLATANGTPHLYNQFYNFFPYQTPYYNNIDNYGGQIPAYPPLVPTFSHGYLEDKITASYLATPDDLPILNILAEVPYSVSTKFTVVPMLVVSKENMKMVSDAHVMHVARDKPAMTIKNDRDELEQCTPAVRITLDQPIFVYSLKSSVVFPSEVEIVHGGIKIPIRVGAVIAPIQRSTFVSTQAPVAVTVVYAIPTRPFDLLYRDNSDAIDIPDNQAIVVESEDVSPPRNISVIDFPEKIAEPSLLVDDDEDELVNRNPPQILAPAGIVQSSQPHYIVQPFQNPKESPVLVEIREESKKRV